MAARCEVAAGRRENAMSGKSLMHGQGESYHGIVLTKQPNKDGRAAGGGCGGKAVDQGEHATV